MRIPDDDLGPSWMRDLEYIDADVQGMRDVATSLEAELLKNYVPHRDKVDADMTVPTGWTYGFPELVEFLEKHRENQEITTALLAEHGNATGALAAAAGVIATRYGDTDGLAAARAQDVEGLIQAPPPATTPNTGVPDPGSQPLVNPGADPNVGGQ